MTNNTFCTAALALLCAASPTSVLAAAQEPPEPVSQLREFIADRGGRLAVGQTDVLINAHGECRWLDNTSTSSDYFVPLATPLEWQSFIDHAPEVVTRVPCCPARTVTLESADLADTQTASISLPIGRGGAADWRGRQSHSRVFTFVDADGATVTETVSVVYTCSAGEWTAGTPSVVAEVTPLQAIPAPTPPPTLNACENADFAWTERGSAGQGLWLGMSSSADGQRLVAANHLEHLHTSVDGGATWTRRTGAGLSNWASVSSSADGERLTALGGDWLSGPAYIHTSADGGATWIQRTGAGQRWWSSIASSADGMKLAAAAAGADYIFTSQDGGATWTQRTGAGQRWWISIASSADGMKLVAAAAGNYIYTSHDGGTTWTAHTGTGQHAWLSVASSSDGMRLVAAASGTGDYLYISTDGGVTWAPRENAGRRMWGAVSSSADGAVLAATTIDSNLLFMSVNGGEDWTQQNVPSPRARWSVTISADGRRAASPVNGGLIYTGVCR